MTAKATGELSFWIMEGDRLGKKWVAGESNPPIFPKWKPTTCTCSKRWRARRHAYYDKMPLNYEHVGGLILTHVPEGKDPSHSPKSSTGSCLSIYTTHFGAGPNFAYRQGRILSPPTTGEGYVAADAHGALAQGDSRPNSSMHSRLRRADLLARGGDACNVIDFTLGLPWDDACLLHEKPNPSAINTPEPVAELVNRFIRHLSSDGGGTNLILGPCWT